MSERHQNRLNPKEERENFNENHQTSILRLFGEMYLLRNTSWVFESNMLVLLLRYNEYVLKYVAL